MVFYEASPSKGNMKPELSIITPGIRNWNWPKLYYSLQKACTKHNWEWIVVGPYPPPEELNKKKNIYYVHDLGNQIRCQQRGLLWAEGEIINWCADDGVALEGTLDDAFDFMDLVGRDKNSAIMFKYFEGEGTDNVMADPSYYSLHTHDCTRGEYIPSDYLGLNTGFVHRTTLLELGGWDSVNFEACMAHADLAVRFQRNGGKVHLFDKVVYRCTHEPGTSTPEHAPTHHAMVENDFPMFLALYNNPESVNRIKIDLDNWEQAEQKWSRRFS